ASLIHLRPRLRNNTNQLLLRLVNCSCDQRDQLIHVAPQKSLGVSGLTIRSSRDRFAATPLCGKLSHRRGRKSARFNSGVRGVMQNISLSIFAFIAFFTLSACGSDKGSGGPLEAIGETP